MRFHPVNCYLLSNWLITVLNVAFTVVWFFIAAALTGKYRKRPAGAGQEGFMKAKNLAEPFRVTDGKNFRLKKFDPRVTRGLPSKDRALMASQKALARLTELQDKLYADDRWALLLIFQAMDAAGKDSTIKHVMSGVNPLGCQVFSFKAPSAEDLDHDFLWRTTRCLPERGRIGIFNRSYYEEVLAVRVHPEFQSTEAAVRHEQDLEGTL